MLFETETASVLVEYAVKTDNDAPRLSFFRKRYQPAPAPFLRDSASRAYSFDSVSKAIFHYVRWFLVYGLSLTLRGPTSRCFQVERELWLPKYEGDDDDSLEGRALHASLNDEFIYGLGETTGPLLKARRSYTLEPRDSLGYDPQSGDGMYKVGSETRELVFSSSLRCSVAELRMTSPGSTILRCIQEVAESMVRSVL